MPLLLLDVNGVLCTKVQHGHPDSIPISSYSILIRPNIKDVISKLSEKYTLAVYSSTSSSNLYKILNAIFGPNLPFAFIADRKYTQLDPRYGSDPNVKSFDTIKPLSIILNNPIFNSERKWKESNTLLLDPDLHKIDINPHNNIIVPPEFTIDNPTSAEDLLQHIPEMMS